MEPATKQGRWSPERAGHCHYRAGTRAKIKRTKRSDARVARIVWVVVIAWRVAHPGMRGRPRSGRNQAPACRGGGSCPPLGPSQSDRKRPGAFRKTSLKSRSVQGATRFGTDLNREKSRDRVSLNPVRIRRFGLSGDPNRRPVPNARSRYISSARPARRGSRTFSEAGIRPPQSRSWSRHWATQTPLPV